jgi:hypothetical protein
MHTVNLDTAEQVTSQLQKVNRQITERRAARGEALAKGKEFDDAEITNLEAERERLVDMREAHRLNEGHAHKVMQLRHELEVAATAKRSGLDYVDAVKRADKAAKAFASAFAAALIAADKVDADANKIDAIRSGNSGFNRMHVGPRLAALLGNELRRVLGNSGGFSFGEMDRALHGAHHDLPADWAASEERRTEGLAGAIENVHARKVRQELQALGG